MANNKAHIIRMILIAFAAFAAYSNSFHADFHFDDYSSIITDPYIRSIDNIPYFFYYNGGPLTIRPVTMATFALNFWIGGLHPFSYHVVNFCIHLANAFLVYVLLILTLKNRLDEHINISFCIALMFAVHPIQTQAVTYVVQRAEILFTFFYLSAIVLFVKANRITSEKSEVSHLRRPAAGSQKLKIHATCYALYAASIISVVLAMGSKEITITLPAVILLYDYFFISEGDIRAVLKKWHIHLLFFILTLLSFLYFLGVSQVGSFMAGNAVHSAPTSGITAETATISRLDYLLTQARVIWTYIKLLIIPLGQNLDYNFVVSKGLFQPVTTLLGAVGIAALLALAVFLHKKQRVISFFILWFFLLLSPTSSIAVLPDVIFEHRAYLPSLGYFAVFVLIVYKAADILFKEKK